MTDADILTATPLVGVTEPQEPERNRAQTARQESDKVAHIHNFRGLAIVFIVATHCMSIFDWTQSTMLREVLGRVVANGTVFFLFIAGYLFDHLSSRYQVLSYWSKKLRYVVIPYLVVSLPAVFVFVFFTRREGMPADFYTQPVAIQVVDFLVSGRHLAPFWFIPTIVLFYVASPLLNFVFSRKIAYFALPFLFVVGVWVPRGTAFQSFVHFLPIWVLGMACSHFRVKVNSMLSKRFWLLPIIVLGLFAAEMAWAPGTHSWYSDVQKAVLAVFLLEGLRRVGARADPWFGLAGTLSFGLFFLHSYVITAGKLFINWILGGPPAGSLALLLLAAMLAMLVSMSVVYLIKEMAGHRSRFLIGV